MAVKHPGPGQHGTFIQGWRRALAVQHGVGDEPHDSGNNTWWAFGYRHGLLCGAWNEGEVEDAYEWTRKENSDGWHKGKNVDVTKYWRRKQPFRFIRYEDAVSELGRITEDHFSEMKHEFSTFKKEVERSEPELTEGTPTKTITQNRRARSDAFRVAVKELYGDKCAICGKGLPAPSDLPKQLPKLSAVDSAHIYPKFLDGKDHPANGICLCKMHHWALDAGWLAITDEYRVVVRKNLPAGEQYDFIRDYDGKRIHLPPDLDFRPHPKYLRAHRQLMGFN